MAMKKFLWSLVALLFVVGCSDEEATRPQGSDDVELAATECLIYYYGDKYAEADLFTMCISDKPCDAYGNTTPGSTNCLFSIYTEAKDYEYEKVELPEGTYRLDAENTYAAGTLAAEETFLCCTDDNRQDSNMYYKDATLTVTRQTQEATEYLRFEFDNDEQPESHGWTGSIGGSAQGTANLQEGAYVFDVTNPGGKDGDVKLAKAGFALKAADYKIKVWAKSTVETYAHILARDENAEGRSTFGGAYNVRIGTEISAP